MGLWLDQLHQKRMTIQQSTSCPMVQWSNDHLSRLGFEHSMHSMQRIHFTSFYGPEISGWFVGRIYRMGGRFVTVRDGPCCSRREAIQTSAAAGETLTTCPLSLSLLNEFCIIGYPFAKLLLRKSKGPDAFHQYKKNWAHHWQITEDCAAVAGSLLLEDLWAAHLQCRARPYLAGCRSGLAFGNVGKGKQKMVKNGTWKIDDIWWHWFSMIMTIYIMGIIPHTHTHTSMYIHIHIIYTHIYMYMYYYCTYIISIVRLGYPIKGYLISHGWPEWKIINHIKKNMIEISTNIKTLKQIIKH